MPDAPRHAASPAQTPIELEGTKQEKPFMVAGGLRAIREVATYGLKHAGLGNTLRTVGTINQTSGFDCQSCAWPNPDGERSITEFCENGFKAVTYEATSQHIGADFFRRHSVADLAAHSDHWLGHQGRLIEPLVLRPGATHYEPIAWSRTN